MHSIYAVIMGVVEGLTEFLPISSTGHLILTQHLLGLEAKWGKDAVDAFVIIIQLGAILAVVAAYPGRFAGLLRFKDNRGLSGLRGIGLLVITSIPASLVGLKYHEFIKNNLFGPRTVAAALAVGAVWILAVEWLWPKGKKEGVDAITWKEALSVGFFQCLSLWPGMSRAASTILGGMISGLERKTATEYSFFAAVPIMIAATIFELYKSYKFLSAESLGMIAIGFVVSFIFAWLAVKFFIRFLSRHTLTPFGWYRLILAGLVVWFLAAKMPQDNWLDLDGVTAGKLPQGWIAAKTGEGPGSEWQVVEDSTAPGGKALAQTSADGPNALFNLCVAEKTNYLDVDLRVAFKAVAGKIDQGGGLVWRYKDAKNYYISRMNPLENNFRLYKVVDGKRTQLDSVDVNALAGKWHTLRVVQEGNRIQCYLNDKLELESKDETFKEPGKIGFWTKADAQTHFAGLRVKGK
jgi:undecaprenyl-diphosphatase